MTENGLDIQTVSTKQTDKLADRVLLLGQVTEKKEKSQPFAFFKTSFSQPTSGTFGFAPPASRPFAKPTKPLFANAQTD